MLSRKVLAYLFFAAVILLLGGLVLYKIFRLRGCPVVHSAAPTSALAGSPGLIVTRTDLTC